MLAMLLQCQRLNPALWENNLNKIWMSKILWGKEQTCTIPFEHSYATTLLINSTIIHAQPNIVTQPNNCLYREQAERRETRISKANI